MKEVSVRRKSKVAHTAGCAGSLWQKSDRDVEEFLAQRGRLDDLRGPGIDCPKVSVPIKP